jgi:hypothetical protein
MRRVFAVLAFVALFWPVAVRADQSPAVVISAQQIALYSDRSVLIADGGVSAHMPGLQITATRLGYDLRANRLVATGDVSVTDAKGTTPGQGYAYDFNTHRGAFNASLSVPELSTTEAVAVSQQVELRPAQSISFSNAQVRSGSTFTPVAAYTYSIPPPSAKDFGYSPVPSAALDYAFLLAHGADAYAFARARYDRYNGGPGAGLEEHYARTDRGYVALGQTLDRDYGRFDLAAYQRINDSYSQTLTGSSYPDVRALRYALSTSGRHGFASLSFSQFNGTRTDDIFVAGNQRPVARLGSIRLSGDLAHDVHPYDYTGAQDFRLTPSIDFNSAGLRVGGATLSTSVSVGESLYNYGRGTLHSSQTFWGTFPATPKLIFSGGATFTHDAPPYPSTFRTYTIGGTWRASHAFNLVSSLTYTHDYAQAFQIGRPIFSAAFNVRVIRKNGTGVEVGAILPFGGVGNLDRQSAFNLRFFKE